MPSASRLAFVELLGRLPLFSGLEPEVLAALAERAKPRRYDAGDVLFREGDACAGLFVLTSGSVRIYKVSSGGRELTLHVQKAPATVAEVPLVDGGPYPASVRALTEVETLFLGREDFLGICRRHPEVALAALTVFGRRLRGLVALLEAVTFGGLRQRLAAALLDQAAPGEAGVPTLSGTQQEIALHLGTVREVVARILSRFQADGLIRIRPRAVELVDVDGLRREAEVEL
ncbi:MAG TPA: Crp/Fnr family transcriptional regulator [Terriglobales bacterium]|nr:Crp/Fnr family transcriptional regulator [Terriglobales bacterium]